MVTGILSILKFPGARLGLIAFGALVGTLAAEERTTQFPLVPDARSADATEWRFTNDDPGSGWSLAGFDESNWLFGKGGFAVGDPLGANVGHDWTTSDIWLRKTFTLTSADFGSLVLYIHHDDDVEVYLNGNVVLTEGIMNGGQPEEITLPDDAKAMLQVGSNILAIHCRNNGGPGFIDAGLFGTHVVQATTLVTDARGGGEDWSLTDVKPGAGWEDTGYADDGWLVGHSGFGSAEFSPQVGTSWSNYEIWIRKHITADKLYDDFILSYLHDDEMELYVNGNLVVQETGSGVNYHEVTLHADKVGLAMGDNVIAVHCTNSGGGPQFIDAGLIGLVNPITVGLKHGKAKASPAAASGSFPRVLYTGADKTLNLSGFPVAAGARLEVYGLDGTLRATLNPESRKSLVLPSRLGTGTFRYLWRSPLGSGQGLLKTMP